MKKYIALFLLTFTFLSCSSFLDKEPLDFISPEQYYNTAEELEIALTGVYSTFIKGGTYLNNLARTGFDADESYNYRELNSVSNYAVAAGDSKILSFWREYYAGINRANTLLENIDKATAVSQKQRDRIKGEALFLRGYFYFMLVSNFGDVPLILNPIKSSNNDAIQVSRTDQKVVYNQIIADMTLAAGLVDKIETVKHGGQVNQSAVHGLLARVCLYMAGYPIKDVSKYAEARKWAKLVMDNSTHKLNASFQDVFINYAQNLYDIGESIFEIEFYGNGVGLYANIGGSVGNTNGIRQLFDFDLGYTFSYMYTTAYSYQVYEAGDLRRDWSIAPFYYEEKTPTREIKYPVGGSLFLRSPGKFRRSYETLLPKHRDKTPQNFPILRFSDVLLMFAEADNEVNQGPSQEGYDAINRVRRRGFGKNEFTPYALSDLSGLNYNSFLLAIQKERTRELSFENMRKFDLVRWGVFYTKMKESLTQANAANVDRAKTYFTNVTERDVIWPIPSYELNLNPNLTQNPGW